MKTYLSSIAVGIVFILGILCFPDRSSAAVNDGDVNSVLNGLITQQMINQTNKPQFSDHNGSSESIDPATGKLVWKRTDIHLPGRDGLDLDIGIMFDSNNAFTYQRIYGYPGLKKYNYLVSRYDLGVGWSFQFPSIQLADGYLYYHNGEGAVYRVDFGAYDTLGSFTHLVGYQGKDMKIMQDTSGLFNNGQTSSAYYLEYADKKREYFAADGRLLGIVDRYGNKITFQHVDRQIYDGQTYKVISSITDTVGNIVSFTYDSTLQSTEFLGEGIYISVKDANGVEHPKVVYKKSRSANNYNGSPDGYSPLLWLTSDYNDPTYFSHEAYSGKFHYERKVPDTYSGQSSYWGIKQINRSNSITNYGYEKVARNMGAGGFGEEFRVSARYDQIKNNYTAIGDSNHLNYNYTEDYTGYPTYYNPNSVPDSFSYSSKQTLQSTSPTNGLATTTTFNGRGQITSTDTTASNGERKVISNLSFHSLFTSMPTYFQSTEYGVGDSDSTANKLVWEQQYTDWGGIQSQTRPLTQTQFNDATTKSQYTTNFTYDPTYYFLKTLSWYQNQTTNLTEAYDYYANGRLKSYKNPNNEVTTYCYEASGGASSNCSDPNAAVTGKINKVKQVKNLGNGTNSVIETLFSSDTDFAYPSEVKSFFTTRNSAGQNITQIIKKTMAYEVGTGLLKEEFDGNGNKTSYTYDSVGRVTQIMYPMFTNLNGVEYDVFDNYAYVNTVVPASTDQENAGINSLRVNQNRKYVRKSDSNTVILSDQYAYYDGFGLLKYAKQSDQITQYHNDDLSRPVYAIDPMGNTMTVAYDVWGSQKEATDVYSNLYVSENNMKARRNTQFFVASNNVSTYRANPSQSNLKSNYVEQDYDQWGQLITNRAYKDWPNQSQLVTEAYTYDITGNMITYTDPNKNLNAEGNTSKYNYDALNRLTVVKDALGQLTKYQYDANGQVINTSMQSQESDTPKLLNSKSYNEIGLPVAKTDPSSSQESYLYNNLGLLNQVNDRNGNVFTYQYDEQYRNTVKSVTDPILGINQQNKSIIGSNGILVDTFERYQNNTKTASMTTTIDSLRRIKSINNSSTGYTSVLGLNYDKNNRIISTNMSGAVPGNFNVQYKYNLQRLDKVQIDGLSTINNDISKNVQYTYYSNGQLKSVSYPPLTDGTILLSEYQYDALNRMTNLVNKKGSAVLSSNQYQYDDNGNILTVSQTVLNQGTRTNQYTYDKLNRIQTVTRWDGSAVSYTYDLKGNRLTSSDTSEVPFIMDDTSYAYDLFNTLTSATVGANTTLFNYSADGMRYKKSTGANVTQYRYNQSGEVISETNGNDQTTANYVRGDRLLVKKDVTNSKDYYYLYNGHGDVIQIIDTSGNVVNSYSYDEWGSITQKTEQISNSFKYAGEVYDEETGLYYLRARYYDPSMGRFINEDTYEGQINNPLSLNLYTYVGNNPLIYTDPSGHKMEIDKNIDPLYNSGDRSTLAKADEDFKKAKRNNDIVGMQSAHDQANLIRLKYADSVTRVNFISGGSSSVSKTDNSITSETSDGLVAQTYIKGEVSLSVIASVEIQAKIQDGSLTISLSLGTNGQMGASATLTTGVSVNTGNVETGAFIGTQSKFSRFGVAEGKFSYDIGDGDIEGIIGAGVGTQVGVSTPLPEAGIEKERIIIILQIVEPSYPMTYMDWHYHLGGK